MKVKEFVNKYYIYAKGCENRTGVPALFTLAQAALETGWGNHAPGNMFFGIKDTDGINGNEQLLTTTEYSKKPIINVSKIISKTFDPIKKLYKFIVKDYFRKYNNPQESFEDHAKLFLTVSRYTDNFIKCGPDPNCFAEEVARDGYATDPNYANKLKKLISIIRVNL